VCVCVCVCVRVCADACGECGENTTAWIKSQKCLDACQRKIKFVLTLINTML